MRNKTVYRPELDVVKALSIIAVVFYHIGWLETGYLGVDVFFVINGFLVIPSLVDKIQDGSFSYLAFLLKRTLRLWPLILLAGCICLIIGYIGMLPDDYENLAQSVIASNSMSQNILSAITTKNYWDASNSYKPLMHFWYVGILMELYCVLPILLILIKRLVRSKCNYIFVVRYVLVALTFLSLLLYLMPNISANDKFYFLPYRLWELTLGGIIGLVVGNNIKHRYIHRIYGYISLVGLILILCCSLYAPYTISEISPVSGLMTKNIIIPQNILLILSVVSISVFLVSPMQDFKNIWWDMLIYIGKMSFSIFVWHQILLAFVRYFYGNSMPVMLVFVLLIATFVLSIITYQTFEKKIKTNWRTFALCCVAYIVTCVPAFYIYIHAGVVRDVPELNVYKGKSHRGQFAAYCDRVYAYDVDFPKNGRKNVLVEGVSFGRDFANILLESNRVDSINLSYIYLHDEKYAERYANCDYVFTFRKKEEVPEYFWDALKPNAVVYGIGPKNYGESNGAIYVNRNKKNYFNQFVKINPNFHNVNQQWKESWGDYYINFLELSTCNNGLIRVFTDNHKYISQDCRHLTQDGAKWYANIINWDNILN